MGLLTLDEFREDLNFALGDKKQSANRRLDRWVNKSYFEVANLSRFEGLRECATAQTVVDQKDYAVPADFLAMIGIVMPDIDTALVKRGLGNITKFDPAETGEPKYWSRKDQTISLWPSPDTADWDIDIYYIKEPPALAASEDVTVLPQAYDQPIHWLAIRNAWLDLGNKEDATFFFNTAMNYLRTLRSEVDHGAEAEKQGVTIARTEADLRRVGI